MKKRYTAAIAAIAGAATVAFANPVSADPQKGRPVELTCGEDEEEYDAVVFGSGRWNPALVTDSNVVFHPVAFKDVAIGEFTPPDIEKNGQRRGVDVVECDFLEEFVVATEDGAELTITVTGTVVAFQSRG